MVASKNNFEILSTIKAGEHIPSGLSYHYLKT